MIKTNRKTNHSTQQNHRVVKARPSNNVIYKQGYFTSVKRNPPANVIQKERVVNVYANQSRQKQNQMPLKNQPYKKYSISKYNNPPVNIHNQQFDNQENLNYAQERLNFSQSKKQNYPEDNQNAYQTQQDDDKHSVTSTHSFRQYGLTINVTSKPSISKSFKNDFEPNRLYNQPKAYNKSNPYNLKNTKDEYLFDKPMNIVKNIYNQNDIKKGFNSNLSNMIQNENYETQSVQFDRPEISHNIKQEFNISESIFERNIPKVKSQVKSFQPQIPIHSRESYNKIQQRSFKKQLQAQEQIQENENDKEQNEFLEQEIHFQGGKYVGQIFDGQMNGRGVIYDDQNKVQYEGGFKDGNFDGYGKLYNPNNKQLNIDCSKDLKMAEQSWTLYEGTFKDNQKQGIGYFYFSNNDMFCGEFKNDQANGFGIYTFQKNKICGIWQNDKLVERINQIIIKQITNNTFSQCQQIFPLIFFQ